MMSGESLFVILLVGLIAGWLAGQIVRGTGGAAGGEGRSVRQPADHHHVGRIGQHGRASGYPATDLRPQIAKQR
jgi:hypothetical protein